MRAFIAFDFSQELKIQLNSIQKSIKSICYNGSWVNRDNFHLTLKFLGEIDNKYIKDIDEILKNISKNNEQINIRLSEIGFFRKKNNEYSVVWAGFNGELDKLNTIFNIIDEQMHKIGFDREKRKFKPHATLVRRLKTDLEFHKIKERVSPFLGKKYVLNNLVLMKSEEIMKKRVYTPILSYNLIKISNNSHR